MLSSWKVFRFLEIDWEVESKEDKKDGEIEVDVFDCSGRGVEFSLEKVGGFCIGSGKLRM